MLSDTDYSKFTYIENDALFLHQIILITLFIKNIINWTLIGQSLIVQVHWTRKYQLKLKFNSIDIIKR